MRSYSDYHASGNDEKDRELFVVFAQDCLPVKVEDLRLRHPCCVDVLCALRSLRSSFSPVSGDDADIPVDAPEFVGQEKTAHCAHDHRLTSPACAASFNLAFKLSTPVETPYAKIVSRASVARSRIK